MDPFCFRPSPHRPTAGQIFRDYFSLNGQDEYVKDCLGYDLSLRHSTPFQLEEYRAQLMQNARVGWPSIEQVPTVVNRASTAPYQGSIPLIRAENGTENTHRLLPGEDIQHSQRKPRPYLLNIAVKDSGQRQSLRRRREQPEHPEFEAADNERRFVQMGLGGQQHHGERPSWQTALSLPIPPDPNNYLFPQTCVSTEIPIQQVQVRPKAQKQRNDIPACGHWGRNVTNDVLLNARDKQEARDEKLAQQKREEQKSEQEKVRLPAAKPRNQYPRPSRISGPIYGVQDDGKERSVLSDRGLSMHLKSSMAYPEAYRKYPEDKERKKEEEQRNAALSVPTPEATRTESVKQLLTSVNKALEQKVEAAELEAADAESEACRSPSQHQGGPEDAYQATRKCGESFWHEYSTNYPPTAKSIGTHFSQSSVFAYQQSPRASPCRSKGADEPTRRIRRKSVDSSRKGDYRAATEAIDKVPGDLLQSPTTVSAHDQPSSVGPSIVSTLRNEDMCSAKHTSVPLVSHKAPSVHMSGKSVSGLPVLQAGPKNMSTAFIGNDGNSEDPARAEPLGGLDIELDWEEIGDGGLGDEDWSDVERDFGGDDM